VRGVNPREARLLALATGYYSVAELALLLRKPVIDVAKDVYGLVLAGHVVLKGLRSGRAPKVEAEEPLRELVPVSVLLARAGAQATPESREEETAIVRLQPPPPRPLSAGADGREEPLPETVGGGIAQEATPRPAPSAMEDSQRMVKLMNFTQRIAQAAKQVLPEPQHELVNRLQAKATQEIISGEGPDAVKGLALAISRGAVEAGCDGNLVRALNTQLKALFTPR